MFVRIIKISIISVLVVITQNSFISSLPAYLCNANLIVVILVLVLILGNLRNSIVWCLVMGIIWDFITFTPFPLHAVALFIMLMLSYLLLMKFFTNRSLYSFLALAISATVIYQLFFQIGLYLFGIFGDGGFRTIFGLNLASLIGREIIVNAIIMIFIFYFLHIFTKKLKPVFLGEQKY